MSVSVMPGRSRDWLRQPLGIVFWWGAPLALAISTDFLSLSLSLTASIWAVAYAWMGTGCVLNALRCGRRHCFISGPVLWLGAIAVALAGAGVLSGRHTLSDAINITAAVAALSFLPEWVWGKYRALSKGG